jgi:poly(3-hydroxybutyrate) depolymerase
MGVQASGIVAAVACHSMYLMTEPSQAFVPIPFMEIHGMSDKTVMYGEFGGFSLSDFSAPGNQQVWRKLNKCEGGATESSHSGYTISKYESCEGGTEVVLVSVEGSDHDPYQGQHTSVDTTQLAWDFVKRFSKSPRDDGGEHAPGGDPAHGGNYDGDTDLISLIGSTVPMFRMAWSLVIILIGNTFLQA